MPLACHALGRNLEQLCWHCLLCRQGFAYTCGRGEYGRLGHGDAEDCWVPRRVEALAHTRLVRVSCGESHTVLADAAGVVYSCGSNRAGALGLGDTADRLAPEVRCFCAFAICPCTMLLTKVVRRQWPPNCCVDATTVQRNKMVHVLCDCMHSTLPIHNASMATPGKIHSVLHW